jgi:hypothetical protein
MKKTFLLVVSVVYAGCGTGYNRGALDASLQESRRAYVSSDLTVEQIEQTRPQMSLPARIAVAPPVGGASSGWTADEIRVIESWAAPLRAAGVASEVVILPSSLVDGRTCELSDHRCRLLAQRTAAARTRADALLVVNFATSTDHYVNPASLLYLSLVGLFVAPGTHENALTIAEGLLIDNRNEYLYAFARGEGEQRTVRPSMYVDEKAVVAGSRLAALQTFGDAFVQQASGLK